MSEERWLAVVGYEGFYEVSDLGRVRSLPRPGAWAGRVLKPARMSRGYLTVGLSVGSSAKTHRVHRLVLSAFVGPAGPGEVGCHGNGDKTDNRLSNLRWATSVENRADMARHGTLPVGQRHGCAKLTEEQALAIKRDTRPRREIASEYGVSWDAVMSIQTGRSWAHLSAA